MPAESHVHSYVRVDGMKDRYMCHAPTCTHHMDRKFLINKLSACPSCATKFVLTRDDLRLKVPKCVNCRNTKEGKAYRAKQEALKDTVASLFDEIPRPAIESPLDEHGREKPKALTFEDILGISDDEEEEDEEFELEGDNLHG